MGKSSTLDSDPRIQAFEARRDLETKEAFLRFIACVFIGALGLTAVLLVDAYVTDLGATTEVIVGVSTAVMAFGLEGYLSVRRQKAEDFGELLTLSSVFYQSPDTIKSLLTPERVHASIEMLLRAALPPEVGSAYWEQAVEPYIEHGIRGFKEDWTYDIDLKDLANPIVLSRGADKLTLDPKDYVELHTSLRYTQKAFDAHPTFHIACAFESSNLPEWFMDPNFFLREIVVLEDADRECLARLFPSGRDAASGWRHRRNGRVWPFARRGDFTKKSALARKLFDARLRINGLLIEPHDVWADNRGLRWTYAISADLQKEMKDEVEIAIELTTVQPKTQKYFPVYLATPTRHPTVRFDWGGVASITDVELETFFSAQRPYDERLRQSLKHYGRIEVHTRDTDWVFVGSGCIFVWN